MAAILIDTKPGDEIIMPSFTLYQPLTFVLRGAKIVFVDIRPDTMNIDETKIEAAMNVRVPSFQSICRCCLRDGHHYGYREKHDLFVIEDAAQGVMSTYKGKALGLSAHWLL